MSDMAPDFNARAINLITAGKILRFISRLKMWWYGFSRPPHSSHGMYLEPISHYQYTLALLLP